MKKWIGCLGVLLLLLMPLGVQAQTQGSYIVIAANDGNVLRSQNEHEVRSIASISKIMTAVIALENGDYIDQWVIGDELEGVSGSMIWKKILTYPAPSRQAASSSAFGILIKYCLIRKVPKALKIPGRNNPT